MTEKIDEVLYSRQIGAIGMDTMKKFNKLKILIIGLRGLGIEIAKNIILMGPNKVSIYDPQIAHINDLTSNFFLTEEDIKNKKRRDEASIRKLSELNSYVMCDIMDGSDIFSQVNKYNLITITEVMNKEKLYLLNEECRKNNVGFIYAADIGITCFCFIDFGDHIIKDKNGEERKKYFIQNINKNGDIFIDRSINNKSFNINKGNYIIFKDVKGINELNDGKPRKIIKSTPISFNIEDNVNYENYISGGICEEVKETINLKYESLKNRFYNPYMDKKPSPFDFTKIGRGELIHCGILALHEFYEKNNNSLPELNNSAMSNEILEISKEIYKKLKSEGKKWIDNIKSWNDRVILNIGNWAKSEINPICSFLGGIVAQEIVKFTGKYTPINQWFWCEFSETIENLPNETDRTLKNSRYDDQIAIFGNDIQEKLSDLNIFMIGAGALGCEFLKNFALMGISTNNNKSVIVTDDDNIEFSNLSRQFLFRKKDIGKSKSKVACQEIKKLNNVFNCIDMQARVGQENEGIFNDKFWENQDYIINAVDNIKARIYIDKQCTFYEKPLIDSGTLGTQAHTQIIIPHVTKCYNDSKPTEENPINLIPMCTLHNFPITIEHCIEWGRELFNTYFNEDIIQLKNYIENKDNFYEKLKKEDIFSQLKIITNIKNLIIIIRDKNFDKCIELAIKKFNENYYQKINELLEDFPEDHLNKDGSKFWSGSKRFPHPINFNVEDELHLSFVKYFSIILARILGVSIINDNEYIKNISKNFLLNYNSNKIEEKLKKDEEIIDFNNLDNIESLMESMLNEEENKEVKTIKEEIDKIIIGPTNIKEEMLDKDNDSKCHIDFIFSCSIIRAKNYNIEEIDKQNVKMIAGRIIPALSTTTAAITGIVCLQIYTLLQTNKINYFKNCFMNLAVNSSIMVNPSPQIFHKDKEYDEDIKGPVKAIPMNWTVWDKIIINGSKTVKEFIDYIKKEFDIDIIFITSNGLIIIQTFLPSNTNDYNMKIEQIYKKEAEKKNLPVNDRFLILEINGEQNKIPVLMPLIKYNYINNSLK